MAFLDLFGASGRRLTDPGKISGLAGATICVTLFALFLYWWDRYADPRGALVLYFGRPFQVLDFAKAEWLNLLVAGALSLATAILSLALSGLLATALLAFGMLSDRRLARIERSVAIFQTVPTLVIVTVAVVVEREILKVGGLEASPDAYCVVPVTLSLVFTPLLSGIRAVEKAPIAIKMMLRMWNGKPRWRVWQVYIPYATSDILTGVRASATWALGAVLITEALVTGVSGDKLTLGHALIRPFSTNPPGQTLSVIVIAVILGYAAYGITVYAQRRIERAVYGDISIAHQRYPLQADDLIGGKRNG